MLGGEVVCLSGDELDRVLQALATLDCRGAETVREQIAALRLAGGTIDLMPTEAESASLRVALETLGEEGEETGQALARLTAICADGDPPAGVSDA